MKHKIVNILAFLCYWMGIDTLFYYLNRKAKRIITFHNVMPEHLLPEGKRVGLTETEEEFKMMICEVQKHFTISNDLQDVRTATITFDDGYRNQCDVACKWLIENGLEGIIFAAGKMINNSNPTDALIIDLLLHWTELADNGGYDVMDKHIELTADNRSQIWQKYIWPAFVCDYSNMGATVLKTLDKEYPISKVLGKCSEDYLQLRMTGITEKNIQYLRMNGIQVGWHTYNHYPLSALSIKDQKREIVDLAPSDMRSIVFSYPYGELYSVDADSIQVARDGGYPCAVSNVDEYNEMMCSHFLPRYMLPSNKYLLHFELSGLKYFFKHRALLKHL